MRTSPMRVAAAVLSAAVLTFAGASSALAAPAGHTPVGVAAQVAPAPNPALIDPAQTGTLHITKYAGAPLGTTYDNGLPTSVSGRSPLEGVKYEIYLVPGVNLTTNDGWKVAADYYNDIAGAWTAIGSATPTATCTTDASGVCDFTGLDLGLYYVKEVSAPAGYTMAAPFLVTLPMTNPTTLNSWMYEVYVYPKNQQDTITKSVEDKYTVTTDPTLGGAADHQIDYTIETTVTDGDQKLGMYVIYDDLDPSLTFTGVSSTIDGVTLDRCTAANVPAGCGYFVYTASDWGVNATLWDGNPVTGGPVVTIVMTEAGQTTLEAHRAENLFTTLNTLVNNEDEDGIVPNTSSFIPNESWWNQHSLPGVNPETPGTTPPTTPPGIPSNEVLTKYGNLIITKNDPKNLTAAMTGAEFAVYIDDTPADGCTTADVTGIAPVKTGVVSGTTLTITGLQTSNFYNGSAQVEANYIKYCLVETKAPEGYNLNAEAIQFTILAPASTTELASTALTVYNELKNLGNNLPLTGGAGVAAFSTLGLLFVGGGLAYYVVTSRRRREQDI